MVNQTVLSDVEEKAVVEHLATLADWGFPMNKTDLCIFVKSYLDKEGRQVKHFKVRFFHRQSNQL